MFFPANLGSHCLLWSTKALMQMFRSKLMTIIPIQDNELWSSEWSPVEKSCICTDFGEERISIPTGANLALKYAESIIPNNAEQGLIAAW